MLFPYVVQPEGWKTYILQQLNNVCEENANGIEQSWKRCVYKGYDVECITNK